ncbi:hypothetical protein MRB53_015487 [Persea americana]|uniref:Uncharacterized protein n=1 Tax=Persea americana TaxID=3435 RepID=A0ACC2M024_PERAE|nr:hypothetical protein MRB53_015487 [Persea americana]
MDKKDPKAREVFLRWYSKILIVHGDKHLQQARLLFSRSSVTITGRLAPMLWGSYTMRNCELIAGYSDYLAKKASYAERDPITALKKYIIENNLAGESELKSIDIKLDELIEDALEFADASPHPPRSQLLKNVFADPEGFGIGPDGRYRCEDPGFTAGTAQV